MFFVAKLEALTAGSRINGIISSGPVTIQSAKWFGSAVLEVIYKTDSGSIGNTMLYRENENELDVVEQNPPWSFDADGSLLRLVSEAYRINLAHVFDPYLQCTPRPLNHSRTRFPPSMKTCCHACTCE